MKSILKIQPFGAVLLICAAIVNSAFAQNAKNDSKNYSKAAPVWLDFDMETISEPQEIETGYLYDWTDGTLFRPFRNGLGLAKLGGKKEALNFNTLDEVPDSSWFTNRIGVKSMTPEEVKRGPNTSDGPVAGELTVLKGKNLGITPGFWVKDRAGNVYIMKFDPPENPEMASGAEMVATKLFYAAGYNVPENYIFRFRREDLRISEKSTFTDEKGKKRPMTEADLDLILSRIARHSDGSYRALASKLLKGKPKGGFTFSGKRRDDANDIIPHEARRDLRGLRVFSAWTEHNDVRVGNTLDMFVEEDGRKFIRHYLIDFGSTLGSDTIAVNEPGVGREYRIDFQQAAKVALTAGIYQPKWRSEKYDPVYSPSVGRFSAKGFDPVNWRQNFPLAAFAEMTDRDGFWAARIIARFTPEQIRAAVESAEFSNPDDTDYVTLQLIRRQHKIIQAYANRRIGIGNFALSTDEENYVLNFDDYRNFTRFETVEDAGNGGGYVYELKAVGKKGAVIARGSLDGRRLLFTPEIIRRIHESNQEEIAEMQGVGELSIGRPNEKQTAKVYLYGETPTALRIIGIVH
jgi:hypothetical protein